MKYKGIISYIKKEDAAKASKKILSKRLNKNLCKNGVCDLNMFDFCRCPKS